MLKKILIVLAAVVGILIYNTYQASPSDEHVHYHAGFRVYVDGVLQDYTDAKYMNFTPCSEHETKKTKEEEQVEKAHLHDFVGDVVHTHVNGGVWGDLFKNINVVFPVDKPLAGYINGAPVNDILKQPLKSYDTAIFIVGSNEGNHESEIVPVDHIKEVEAKSELCGTN